jgi:hypothetical protein
MTAASGVHGNCDFTEVTIKKGVLSHSVERRQVSKKPDTMIGQSGVITSDVSSSGGAADRIMTLTDMAVTACQL